MVDDTTEACRMGGHPEPAVPHVIVDSEDFPFVKAGTGHTVTEYTTY